MATTVGQVTSANRTVGVRIDMDDAIQILTPTDVPLQRWVGSEPTSSIKVEWLEEDLTPQSDTAATVTGTGPWVLNVTDGNVFRVGDIVHKNDAAASVQYVVDSISTNAVTVSGFAGNATAPANGETFTIVGQYRAEGSQPDTARSVDRTAKFNYTQIGQEKVEASRTQRKRAMYGVGDPYDHEVGKKFKELAIRFEKSMVLGQRAISGAADKRFMGGLFYYITTNTVSNTAANAKVAVNSLLRKCYEQGGSPTVLMVSPAVKEAISANIDPTLRRWSTTDKTAGSVVDRFGSDFGEVEIITNRHFPKTKGLALQKEFIKRKVFTGYFHEYLAKIGDGDQGEIVGEFSLEVKNEKAHGILTITDAA